MQRLELTGQIIWPFFYSQQRAMRLQKVYSESNEWKGKKRRDMGGQSVDYTAAEARDNEGLNKGSSNIN